MLRLAAAHQRNNKLEWEETQRIGLDLFDNEWEQKKTVTVDHILEPMVAVRPDRYTRPCHLLIAKCVLLYRLRCSSSALLALASAYHGETRERAVRASSALAGARPLCAEDAMKYVEFWIRVGHIEGKP